MRSIFQAFAQLLPCYFMFLVAGTSLAAPPPVPSIEGHLTDAAKRLTQDQRSALERALDDIQAVYKVDLAIHLLDTEVPSVEDMSNRCFEAWSIGKSWDGGGLLITVSKDLKDLAITTTAPDKPLNPNTVKLLKSGLRSALDQAELSRVLQSTVARIHRLMALTRPYPKVHPPLNRRVRSAQNFAFGALFVVFLAILSTRVRRWR